MKTKYFMNHDDYLMKWSTNTQVKKYKPKEYTLPEISEHKGQDQIVLLSQLEQKEKFPQLWVARSFLLIQWQILQKGFSRPE